MRTLLLLIVAALGLAATGWFLLAPETSTPASAATEPAAPPAGAADVDAARTADPGALAPPESASPAATDQSSSAAEGPETVLSGDADAPAEDDPRGRLPNAYVTSRLGWPADDARAAFVARWVTDKLVEDDDFFDQLETTPDRGKSAVMQAFNAATEQRRLALLESLGPDAASKVIETWCTYRFDAESLSWHRIDVHGQRVAFQHEDDDIWQNGELADRGWDNHR